MRIEIKFNKGEEREYKRQRLFEAAFDFLRLKELSHVKRHHWKDNVKLGTVISICMLQLNTKGTSGSIEFDPSVDFSHLYEIK